ncbi:MAG: DNA primase [Candidatus Aminicenantes bacterium]|nr:MAG: DNA primase [Candidatus Aminicenantes bacterium]
MEVIDQIRQASSIIEIASQYTSLRLRGKRHVGLCPFHSEKAPSFTVDEEKQLYHCFGCGAGGDIFTLIMEKENLSFPEALKFLADKYNIPLPERRKMSPQLKKLEEQLSKINEDTLAFFKKNLFKTKEGEKALSYLQKRKISPEIIQKLKIGYALNSWDSLISFFQGKGIQPNLLVKAGLALRSEKKKGYYDRFRGRIIFPIFTESGKPVAFGGRTIFDAEPKYLNSPDTPIYIKGKLLYGMNFCKDDIRKKGYAILVEGYTDFLTLFQEGITNLAASLGTSLTSDQVSFAKRFASRMIVSYDADKPGIKAAERAISLCFEKGVQIRVLNLPEGFDPDSFINKFGGNKFKELAQKSTPGLKFLIDTQLQKINEESAEEKAQIAKNIVIEIEKIPDPVVRSEYLKQTSEQLSIDENVLRSMIQRKSAKEGEMEKGTFLNAEKRLLQILLEEKEIAPYIFAEIKEEYFHGLKSKPIFNALSENFRKGKSSSLHELKQKVDPTLVSSLSKAMLEKEQNASVEEAFECLNTLKQLSLENLAKKLNAELTQLERKGDKEKIIPLIKQIQETKKELSILSKRNYQNLSYNNRDGVELERSE